MKPSLTPWLLNIQYRKEWINLDNLSTKYVNPFALDNLLTLFTIFYIFEFWFKLSRKLEVLSFNGYNINGLHNWCESK